MMFTATEKKWLAKPNKKRLAFANLFFALLILTINTLRGITFFINLSFRLGLKGRNKKSLYKGLFITCFLVPDGQYHRHRPTQQKDGMHKTLRSLD